MGRGPPSGWRLTHLRTYAIGRFRGLGFRIHVLGGPLGSFWISPVIFVESHNSKQFSNGLKHNPV